MASPKPTKFDYFINQAYGWGAAVVIIGALFKILHFEIGPLTGGVMLTIGLCCEAIIFAISAFEKPKPTYDWTLAYPELENGSPVQNRKNGFAQAPDEIEASLSKKLDTMLKDAKIDGQLMESLGTSIRNFEGAAKNMAPTVDAIASQKKYSEEMSLAAAQLESLNGLYKLQLESNNRNAEANKAIAANAQKLQQQMEALTQNMSNLNSVYGGMLSAMRPNSNN